MQGLQLQETIATLHRCKEQLHRLLSETNQRAHLDRLAVEKFSRELEDITDESVHLAGRIQKELFLNEIDRRIQDRRVFSDRRQNKN